jgi:4-diphosphocytidyl-2-C-methyl-D-erythritol kinase
MNIRKIDQQSKDAASLLLLAYCAIFRWIFLMNVARRIRLCAFAKINVGLLVLAKRSDGYHDIETIFTEIAWHDVVELMPAAGVSMECTFPSLPADASNLCIKAASLLRQWTNHDEGVHIRLVKNVPIGSGLGGGSSDAAAVLAGLNQFWELGLPTEELERLAGLLGSDVPFFIRGGTALATGRGEVLEHRDVGLPSWILVATPPLHISTAWAYGTVVPSPATASRTLRPLFIGLPSLPKDDLRAISNEFEPGVFSQYPIIRETKEELRRAGALFCLMSGSGSSVFGFFENEAAAVAASSLFPVEYRTFVTPPLFRRSQHPSSGGE